MIYEAKAVIVVVLVRCSRACAAVPQPRLFVDANPNYNIKQDIWGPSLNPKPQLQHLAGHLGRTAR